MRVLGAMAAVLSLGVAGCASTQTVLSSRPSQVLHSNKAAADVAFCLANKNNTTALDRGDGSRVVLVKNVYGAVGRAYTVRADGAGSTIEIREAIPSMGAWRQCVGLEPER